jgi:hypothetical protein
MTETTPKLGAMFVLDANGVPEYETAAGRKHFHIKLFIDDAPANAQRATYVLHRSYFDPVRDVRRDDGKFMEPITSYGDYVVQAKVISPDGPRIVENSLSDALKAYYEQASASPAVQTALNQIENN